MGLDPRVDLAALSGWAVFWTLFFTAATYVNAGWMREQVCIYMCPYARFQSAMIDKRHAHRLVRRRSGRTARFEKEKQGGG